VSLWILARYNLTNMFGGRELFILAGAVRVDPGHARRASLELAMVEIEQLTRAAVDLAGQKVIEVRVVPGELTGTVFVDIRFRGDRAGAIAALERWKTTAPAVGGGSVLLRTLLRGADLNLEWSDDGYDNELQAGGRSTQPKPARQFAARRPDSRSRPARRSWLTDWEEANRHPWRTRLFMAAGGGLVGVVVATLTGHLALESLAVAATAGAVVGAAMGEYAMRAIGRLGAGAGRS
jgi:hypothetical protein